MKILSKVVLAISLIGFAYGLSNVGEAMYSGLARAIGAVFFILYYITRVAMAADKEEAALDPGSCCKKPAKPNNAGTATQDLPSLGKKTAGAHL